LSWVNHRNPYIFLKEQITMSPFKLLFLLTMTILLIISAVRDIYQERGDFVDKGTPLKINTEDLVGTDDYLYAAGYCLDWKGNIIWENPKLSKLFIVYLGDTLCMRTWQQKKNGVALVTLEGEILWQRDVERIAHVGIGASHELLAVGTREGILWAFSRTGNVLWEYYNTSGIDQIAVAPDSSRVVFIDYDEDIKCVSNGRLLWSRHVGGVSVPLENHTIAFAPDSSYLVYGSKVDESSLVACTLDGTELWSMPLKKELRAVAITEDGHVIAGCYKYICRFTADGTLQWETEVGGDNLRLAITPEGDYIVVGSTGPNRFFVLSGEGNVLWKAKSPDSILAVAASPDGKYVAFSDGHTEIFIFLNSEMCELAAKEEQV
jgi:outer membrane protein assembly factor BamB